MGRDRFGLDVASLPLQSRHASPINLARMQTADGCRPRIDQADRRIMLITNDNPPGLRQDMDSALLDTLETLIAPGRHSRLSPFVESAQLRVLFGEAPDAERRLESIREILERHAPRI